MGEQQFVLVRHALGLVKRKRRNNDDLGWTRQLDYLDCFIKQVCDVLNIKWHRVKEEV